MKILILLLNDKELIELSSYTSPDKMGTWDDIEINFCGAVTINLYDSMGDLGLSDAIDVLTKVLSKKFFLHESIKQNVGYLWNEVLQGKKGLECELVGESLDWVGERFLMWSPNCGSKNSGVTWLYNNKEGEIILEITPTYPWTFFDPELGEAYISYDEYMKTYKPLIVRTISHETAKEWLRQIQDLERTIQESEKRMDDPAVDA